MFDGFVDWLIIDRTPYATKAARTVWTSIKSDRIVRDGNNLPDGSGSVSTPDGSASSIKEVVESSSNNVLYVVFTRSVYPFFGGGFEPTDINQWRYTDASNGGVSIESVSLSENKMVATVNLSGAVGTGDIIRAGDFHTPSVENGQANLCFGLPNSSIRGTDGTWTLQ